MTVRGGMSHHRETGTGVAMVEKRKTKAGMRVELREIQRHLDNTDNQPLNKTEHERLRRRKKAIIKILKGRDPRFDILNGKPGPPPEHKAEEFGTKIEVVKILDLLEVT